MDAERALLANEAFYLAFAEKNLAAMDRVWSERRDVVCVHPGWPALTDRHSVMESWRRILGNAEQPRVGFHTVTATTLRDAVVVVCYEKIESSVMVATNVFIPGRDGAAMVVHQSGPCSDPPALPDTPVPAFNA